MSNINFGTVAMCRYTVRSAMFPVLLALLIACGQSYAGAKDADASAATRPTKQVITTANDSQVRSSAAAAKASESEEEYETPLSDYENGGYFTDDKVNQSVTLTHKSKAETRYETPLSDYENGGYFANQ